MKLKTGDKVVVISGSNKGKEGTISKILKEENRVVVSGVNLRKKHLKPKNNNGTGEIVEVEAPIHASNVMLLDPVKNKPTRVSIIRDENGKKIRVSKKSDHKFD